MGNQMLEVWQSPGFYQGGYYIERSTIDPYHYESVDAMIADVRKKLDTRITDCSFPDALHNLVQRKMEKVCTYVLGPDTAQR